MNESIRRILSEIAELEMCWCPIKHARKVPDRHRRYARFADFGSGVDLDEHLARMRSELREQRVAVQGDHPQG